MVSYPNTPNQTDTFKQQIGLTAIKPLSRTKEWGYQKSKGLIESKNTLDQFNL